jgi:uncharacterized protein (DUF1778 family)
MIQQESGIFMEQGVTPALNHVVEGAAVLRLTREDQIRFAQALINPPKANERLVRAAKRHAALVTAKTLLGSE